MAIVVNQTDCQQLEGNDISSRNAVEQTTVSAQFMGIEVDITKDCFLWSNDCIKCTGGMAEGKRLRKFWYRCWMWQSCVCKLYIVYCFACFFVWIHLVVAVGIFIGSFLFFVLSCQYITISWAKLLLVKKQPIVEGRSNLKDFVKVNVDHLSAEYAVARDAGYGRLCAESGMIKFQVLDEEVARYMNSATKRSVTMFIVSIVQLGWSGLWIYYGAHSNGSVLKSLQWSSDY